MTRASRAALLGASALAAAVLIVHLAIAIATHDQINLVSGVWLALAIDMRDGVFYRALIDSGQYGGTRYFPLLFVTIGGLVRARAAPVAAGLAVSAAGGVVLVTGGFRLLRALGADRPRSAAGAVLAAAPYFVEQAMAQIRVEPLVVGFVLLGAATVARRIRGGRGSLFAATAWFTLAFLGKMTAVYAGAAGAAALVAARRPRDAWRLALSCAAAWALAVAAIDVLSAGRALISFRACTLAGGSIRALMNPNGLMQAIARLWPFRLVTITLLAAGALLAARPRRILTLPGLLLIAGVAATAVTLASPGTIVANQTIEPYAIAAVLLVSAVAAWRAPVAFGDAVLALCLIAVAAQSVREFGRLSAAQPAAAPEGEASIQQAVSGCRDPILAESPLVPAVARRPVVLLDPFAFRVVAARYPSIGADLVRRVESREFGCVILDHDPQTPAGRGWYTDVSFGADVLNAVLAAYHPRGRAGTYLTYVPAPRSVAR